MKHVSVDLIPKAEQALAELASWHGLSEGDIVNRALQVYGFVDQELARGHELLSRDPRTGTTEIMHISERA